MVVFPVDVTGYTTADGGKPGSRRDGQKPSPGKEDLHNLGQADSRLTAQQTCPGIEVQKPIQPFAQDHGSLAVERGVAVGTTQAPPQIAR